MARPESSCPLCGARLQPAELLDACDEIIDAGRGVLAAHCPHCQGYLEVLPQPERLGIGYLINGGRNFDVVVSLPCQGLAIHCDETGSSMAVTAGDRCWKFGD